MYKQTLTSGACPHVAQLQINGESCSLRSPFYASSIIKLIFFFFLSFKCLFIKITEYVYILGDLYALLFLYLE